MAHHLTPTKLKEMEDRLFEFKKNDFVRAYRRDKAKQKPGQHPASIRSQAMVKEIKALEMSGAASQARQKALDAFTKSPADDFARGVRESAQRIASAAPEATQRYLILGNAKQGYMLMRIDELTTDVAYATGVNGSDGAPLTGLTMDRIEIKKNALSLEMFASLADALTYAAENNLKLATRS